MSAHTFGQDPMDQFSLPLKKEKTKFTEIFRMPVRERVDKPGRALSVVWDGRVPLVKGFQNHYSYVVKFQQKGSLAGNHYHLEKQEIYFPIIGNFSVCLEDPKSKGREEVALNCDEHSAIFIPATLAHVVRAESDLAMLLVIASSPQVDSDEFAYKVL